jgi:hypothetical protein
MYIQEEKGAIKEEPGKQKKNHLLTYLLTSHCDSNKDAILFPFPTLVTHCYCANSYFAAADQPQALHQRDVQGGTRTHAWSSSSERQRRVHVASRRAIEPPHQHYYYYNFFFFFFSLFSLLELSPAQPHSCVLGWFPAERHMPLCRTDRYN